MSPSSFLAGFLKAAEKINQPIAKTNEPVIEIHGSLSRLTAAYERLRTFLDYQEERFIRRLAIRRILYRQILLQGEKKELGEQLLKELIRAAYLENGKYPTSVARLIDECLQKYLIAIPVISQRYPPTDTIRIERRLLGIAAAEIEDIFSPPDVDMVLLKKLEGDVANYLNREIDDETRIIALRSLLKADTEFIAWRLLNRSGSRFEPNWQAFLADPKAKLGLLLQSITKLDYELRNGRLEMGVRRVGRLVPPYTILADLTQERSDIAHLAENPKELEKAIEALIKNRIAESAAKIYRSMVRATIYIFMTKIIFGLAIEIPYEMVTFGAVAYIPLTINLLIPPLLMILASIGIRPPSAANNELLVERTRELLLTGEIKTDELEARRRPRRPITTVFFSLFYFSTYLLSFGGLIWFLNRVGFNAVGILIFLFFVSVVGFFAFRIRANAHELVIVRQFEGPLLLVFDFFALPFLRVGRWLSVTIRQVNVTLFILDFLIEAPLKVFLVAIEDWSAFLREKREELH